MYLYYLKKDGVGPARHAAKRGLTAAASLRKVLYGLSAFATQIVPQYGCGHAPERAEFSTIEAALFGDEAKAAVAAVFELDSAFQGQEGLAKVGAALAAERPYATAFIDMRMPPGWDGVETIARLWQADPRLQIVICAAYADYSWNEVLTRRSVSRPGERPLHSLTCRRNIKRLYGWCGSSA